MGNSAAIVVLRAPTLGVVCVKEEGKRRGSEDVIYWKFPGGGEEPEDGGDPRKTGQREAAGETGVILENLEAFKLIETEKQTKPGRPEHLRHFYDVVITDKEAKWAPTWIGDEGEVVRVISYEEFETITDFFPPHRHVLERNGLWPPRPPE